MKSSTSKKFAELVTNFPKTVLIFVVGLLVLSSFNLSNFKLDASSDSLVLETDDDLKYYREISKDYSSSDFLIVIFEPNEDLFSQKKSNFVESAGISLRESVSSIFGGPSPADEMRQAYLGTM